LPSIFNNIGETWAAYLYFHEFLFHEFSAKDNN
jgi:hypothetical protein